MSPIPSSTASKHKPAAIYVLPVPDCPIRIILRASLKPRIDINYWMLIKLSLFIPRIGLVLQSKKTMKIINPFGLFDDHFLLEKLKKLEDSLESLNKFIDWDIFKVPINEAFKGELKDMSKGGRPNAIKLR